LGIFQSPPFRPLCRLLSSTPSAQRLGRVAPTKKRRGRRRPPHPSQADPRHWDELVRIPWRTARKGNQPKRGLVFLIHRPPKSIREGKRRKETRGEKERLVLGKERKWEGGETTQRWVIPAAAGLPRAHPSRPTLERGGGKGGRNRVPHNAPAVAPEGRPRKGVANEVHAESGGRDSPPSRQPVTSRANRGECQGRFSDRDRVSKDAESNHKKHT